MPSRPGGHLPPRFRSWTRRHADALVAVVIVIVALALEEAGVLPRSWRPFPQPDFVWWIQ